MSVIEDNGGTIKKLGIETPSPDKGRIEYHEITVKGILPSPKELEQYEQVLPGAAERLLTMVEEEQRFRHEQTMKALENEANKMDVTISAGKANMKVVGQGTTTLIVVIVIFFALSAMALAFHCQTFAWVSFAALIWFLASFGFLKIFPQKQTEGEER